MILAEIFLTETTVIPSILMPLAKVIKGKNFDTAKRAIVAKTGSVKPREQFDDDIADAVFMRLQRTAQIGQYTSEKDLLASGRDAHRLEGDEPITVYRYAPPGAGIRPGDFCTDSAREAGFYKHGGNRLQKAGLRRRDVIRVTGSMGGNQEYVYLPANYVPSEPAVFFDSFRSFYNAVNS